MSRRNLLPHLMLVASLSTSCAAAPVFTQSLRLTARDPAGAPIAGLALTRDGEPIGITDARGVLLHTVQGHAGDTVRLGIACPQGTERLGEAELGVAIVPHRKSEAPLELPATCRPLRHNVTVAVRAPKAPGLAVMHLGREVARLDESGTAQVSLEVAPRQRIELSIDTHGRDDLRPKNPVSTFLVTDRDESFTLDQDFSVQKRAVRMAARPQIPKAF